MGKRRFSSFGTGVAPVRARVRAGRRVWGVWWVFAVGREAPAEWQGPCVGF
jgi:hypothetical protein